MSCRYVSAPVGIHRNRLRRTARLADISLYRNKGCRDDTRYVFGRF